MELQSDFEADILAVSNIPAVSTILEVICRITGMRFAAVARVTDERWVCCAVRDEIEFGMMPGSELEIQTTFCQTIRQNHQPIVIDEVVTDKTYSQHPIPAMYGFQSYISFPIITQKGDFFGTLCALDPEPKRANTTEIMAMFKLFGNLISFHLHAIDDLAQAEVRLHEANKAAELREQFVAILGHDLRNPVSAVLNVSQMLLTMPLDEQTKTLAIILQNSSYRMKELIDNILDFANGRMGEGILLSCCDETNLKEVLMHVIDELLLIWPERKITTEINIDGTVYCDGQRVAQLLSNLLGNALKHGKSNKPIIVKANNSGGEFVLSVTNFGPAIPDNVKQRLFQPFYRGDIEPRQEGLGLGLYISSEIARAHGGTLEVLSTEDKTQFILRLP